MFIRDLRRRSKQISGLILSTCLAGYFVYHLIEGNHGLLARKRLDKELSEAQQKLARLTTGHNKLEHHVKLLRPNSICRDLLDERARLILGFSRPNEIVVLYGK